MWTAHSYTVDDVYAGGKALACEGASEFNCHLSTGLALFQAHNLAFFYKVLKRILFPWLGQL